MVHDWSKLFDGAFHDFHTSWIGAIRTSLNNGLLPPGYYAAAEQVVGGPSPDVVTLDAWQPDDNEHRDRDRFPDSFAGGVTLADSPPAVQYRIQLERDTFVAKANHIAIRHLANDRLVAVIEIVSAGNKSAPRTLRPFSERVYSLMVERVHLVLIDLIRSGNCCPDGLPTYLSFSNFNATPNITEDKPFTLTAVRSGETYEAFVETIGVGDTLTDMPLFLNDSQYIPLPLEQTYESAWQGVPLPWKQKLS